MNTNHSLPKWRQFFYKINYNSNFPEHSQLNPNLSLTSDSCEHIIQGWFHNQAISSQYFSLFWTHTNRSKLLKIFTSNSSAYLVSLESNSRSLKCKNKEKNIHSLFCLCLFCLFDKWRPEKHQMKLYTVLSVAKLNVGWYCLSGLKWED